MTLNSSQAETSQSTHALEPDVNVGKIREYLDRYYKWMTILFVSVIFMAAFIVNKNWLSNKIGDVDTWFYLGYFRNLNAFYGQGDAAQPSVLQTYYQTRFPYILPGWLIYHVLNAPVAKFFMATSIYVINATCIYYSFYRIVGSKVAFASVTLMACDLFFLRSAGWTYVDNGVLTYYCLTLAFLTGASRARSKSQSGILVLTAAFCFTSALLIHLGAGVLLFFILIYSLLVLKIGRSVFDYIAAISGVVIAQTIWGLMNVVLWKGQFFFIIEQALVGRNEMHYQYMHEGIDSVIKTSFWNVMILGVTAATILTFLSNVWIRLKLEKSQSIILILNSISVLIVILGHFFLGSYYLVREGLYSVIFLPTTYISLSILLNRMRNAKDTAMILVTTLFTISLLCRLAWNGSLVPRVINVQAWQVVLLVAFCVTTCAISRSRWAMYLGLVTLSLATLCIPWRFDRDDAIDRAYGLISTSSLGKLPRMAMDPRDTAFGPLYVSIIASFTSRAWFNRQASFPAIDADSIGKPIFVLTSQLEIDGMKAYLAPWYDRVHVMGFNTVWSKQGPFSIYQLTLDKDIEVSGFTATAEEIHRGIPASKLPSLVGSIDGTSRQASAPKDQRGYLTFGPYATIKSGHYIVHIRYSAESDQAFDMVDGAGGHLVTVGTLRPTPNGPSTLDVPIDFDATRSNFEVRTMFSGSGTLKVFSVGIEPIAN